MKTATVTAALIGVALAIGAVPAAELRCDCDFEGGSGKVESIDGQQRLVRLLPTPHKDRGWDCWWYVKISGITPGETISLDVGKAPWATPDRAAVSVDNKHWLQTEPGKRSGKRITYRHKVDASEAWFAWGPPLVPSDAAALVKRVAKSSPYATSFELCRTRAGRPTPALCICQEGADDAERFGIWIEARQHAWESGSSWTCRGLIEWLVSDDPRAGALRKKSRITLVPIMDIDNTFIGAGGKCQKPHDHNRDWGEKPHWHSVRAAIERIKQMDEAGRFDLFLDLHNPGADSKQPFFFTAPADMLTGRRRSNLDRFIAASRAEIVGPQKLDRKVRTTGKSYDPAWERISSNWVSANTSEHVVSVCLETAWNAPHGTTEGYRQLGRQLGLAIERYLRLDPRQAAN